MTTNQTIPALLDVAIDLAADLSSKERFKRLLAATKTVIPCEAAAILRYQNDTLSPVVVDGLSDEVLGRRFDIKRHPRFETIIESKEVTHFAADCDLSDPYDGLVHSHEGDLPVHACMGTALYVHDTLWGIITFDAMEPTAFDHISDSLVLAFSALAAAAVSTATYIDMLESRIDKANQVSEELIQQVLGKESDEMVGDSSATRALRKEIELVAGTDLITLILGESGVGKELVARAIHKGSQRSDRTIVYLNCASLPESLAESELFGHVKGAFTGAHRERRGKFDIADGGTLFLDEVGELSLTIQAKLLRALQSGEIQAVGSEVVNHVDVRIIAATNRDLKQQVLDGKFRQDLFHRLSVFPIQVPALRDRQEDIHLLAGYFIEQFHRKFGLKAVSLDKLAIAALEAYSWPGNIRELEHVISRALLRLSKKTGAGNVKRLELVDIDIPKNETVTTAIKTSVPDDIDASLLSLVNDFQKQIIKQRLEKHNNNWSMVAKSLEVDRSNLYRLGKRLGLK
jgi:anaerobic nitric oxide reductase transcription regulator